MNEENEIEYSVFAEFCEDLRDSDNYALRNVNYTDLISANSVEALYERMADECIAWNLKAEKEIKDGRSYSYRKRREDYYVNFGPIHIIVEEYSEDKMKSTETYKNKGAARDQFLAQQKILEEAKLKAEAERSRIWKEKQEREEYLRLRKKFEKIS